MGSGCTSELCKTRQHRHCKEFTNDCRINVFNYFWSNLNWGSRNVDVRSSVEAEPVKCKTADGESRPKTSLADYLNIKVCIIRFLSTLRIGEWSVHAWVHTVYQTNNDKTDNNNIPPIADLPHPRLSKGQTDSVREF